MTLWKVEKGPTAEKLHNLLIRMLISLRTLKRLFLFYQFTALQINDCDFPVKWFWKATTAWGPLGLHALEDFKVQRIFGNVFYKISGKWRKEKESESLQSIIKEFSEIHGRSTISFFPIELFCLHRPCKISLFTFPASIFFLLSTRNCYYFAIKSSLLIDL